MSVTASRLGSAPLTFDWSNLVRIPSPAPGSGSGNARAADATELAGAWSRLRARFSSGEVGFYDAPIRNELSQAEESESLAESIKRRRQFTDCLFLGIGGSSLGPLSLLQGLQDKCNSGIRFHFMENPDPVEWKSTIGRLSPESTLVCVVTKSGTTFETMAQFLLALEWLGKERRRTHVVAITDPVKGDLRAYAALEDLPTLPIAPSIGGRFSVFSPVGLFAASLAGLNVKEFLSGAKQVRDYIEKTPVEKNPLFILSAELLRHSSKRPIHVCMPYSSRLKVLGSWFVQLWGESLGKEGKGFTPLAAVGATDQHSILQLLRDGPDDKVTFFLTVDKVDDEVRIPKLPLDYVKAQKVASLPAFKLLENHTLHELLMVEYRATSLVLAKQNRPNLTLQIERLDERSMGALYFGLSFLTALTGTLWEVNPFDQPGVEEGKVYIREALSQSGRGEMRSTRREYDDDDDNSPANRLRRGRGEDT